MGLGEFLVKVLKVAKKAVDEKKTIIEKDKKVLSRYNDESLIREYKNSSGDRRIAAELVLKERSVGNKRSK